MTVSNNQEFYLQGCTLGFPGRHSGILLEFGFIVKRAVLKFGRGGEKRSEYRGLEFHGIRRE